MNPVHHDRLQLTTRRQFLNSAGQFSLGAIAMQAMQAEAAPKIDNPLAPKHPLLAAKAKRVIYLHMSGAPPHLDLFDYKPELVKRDGQDCPDSVLKGRRFAFTTGVPKLMGTPRTFKQYGKAGMWMSDACPNFHGIADDITTVRSMYTDQFNHAPAELLLFTGHVRQGRPSMGSWATYGLGTENQDLPAFITIQPGGVREYGSAFLPAIHQGTALTVPLNDKTSPIADLRNVSASDDVQRERIELMHRLNRRLVGDLQGDAAMEGMIQNMELAFRMQTATPQIVDIAKESDATKELYGVGGKDTDKNARACLLARKLSEGGVRFVQVTMGGWDHHGDIRGNLPKLCAQTDRPVAGLLRDLKSRGLLEDTLVLWSGEFGRTPWSQDLSGTAPIDKHGREHQPESFCSWMAGGGIKAGLTFGETDEMGYRAVAGKMHVHDLHATILHQLGIDHTKLTRRHLGRDFRLTDVYGEVVKEILA